MDRPTLFCFGNFKISCQSCKTLEIFYFLVNYSKMSGKPLKILVCGDVKGHIGALFNKIETVNKKSGPFEMVLCLGKFFDDSSGTGNHLRKVSSEIELWRLKSV